MLETQRGEGIYLRVQSKSVWLHYVGLTHCSGLLRSETQRDPEIPQEPSKGPGSLHSILAPYGPLVLPKPTAHMSLGGLDALNVLCLPGPQSPFPLAPMFCRPLLKTAVPDA